MRLREPTPPDPQVLAALQAIDQTLAGESVDPRHAELAELALILQGERPQPPVMWSAELDERLEARFGTPPPAAGWRWWMLAPAAGVMASLLVALVIVLAGTHSEIRRPPALAAGAEKRPSVAAGSVPRPVAATRSPVSSRAATAALALSAPTRALPQAAGPASHAVRFGSAPLVPTVVQAAGTGRKVIQGAQLSLSTAPSRVDLVAQEIFDVAARFGAIVQSSDVTAAAGPGGYGQFELSIPSGSLSQAMSALSSLQYAHVSSRTDTTQDVQDQYQADVRGLADARALRTSLLRQLANAATQEQVDSLTAQIHDAEASISSDEATLRGLQHQIDYSQVSVTINAAAVTPVANSSSFTIGKAARDAGRVLTVAAGVALIGLAGLTPIVLLVALGWWISVGWRHRRREQALDLV